MLNGRTNGNLRCAVRSFPPFCLLLRSCTCLLLLGSLVYTPVEGQRSPCPDVFSYWIDNNTNQPFGYVKLQGLRANQAITLQIDMRIAAIVRKSNVGSITLYKSTSQTVRDIKNNKPAWYRVNFPYKNILPSVVAIRVNGRTICAGRRASNTESSINLQHTIYPSV
uniref:Serine protease gd N-terminal domain-containing protein n=1 Tax=Anopheles quadriannulatus TaxID=34691 RepID=A0A904A5M9_ANOQN